MGEKTQWAVWRGVYLFIYSLQAKHKAALMPCCFNPRAGEQFLLFWPGIVPLGPALLADSVVPWLRSFPQGMGGWSVFIYKRTLLKWPEIINIQYFYIIKVNMYVNICIHIFSYCEEVHYTAGYARMLTRTMGNHWQRINDMCVLMYNHSQLIQ